MRYILFGLFLFAAATAAGQPLSLRHDIQGPVDSDEEILLTLNRPLQPEEGTLAVFLGATDLTALFEYEGSTLRYRPELILLPPGQSDIIVYLVTAGQPWQEVARLPIHVRLPGGFEKASLDPALTLNNKGQLAESAFPVPEPAADHRIYQDFSGQMSLRTELVHSGWMMAAQGQVVGVSYQNEALRFSDLQDEAPKIDLSSYDVTLRRGPVSVQAGHIAHGRHRLLNNLFSSRGLMASVGYGVVDLSVAAMNGSRVVGWRNISGLSEPDHRMVSGTLGIEVIKERLRVEGSYLDGSVLPRTGFNQGGIPDAEESRGGGLRMVAGTPGRRLRLEAGYAASRYTNPFDPRLAQGGPLVPVKEETRFAHYAELTAVILQNLMLSTRLPASLQAVYRRERVDPLYRTVATYVQADNLHNAIELQGSLGPVSLQLGHTQAEDNLSEIPSILKTKTRRRTLNLGVPVRSLTGGPALVPIVSYGYDETHQFGAELPVNGGFSPTHLPDQVNRIHNGTLTWQGSRWSVNYRMMSAFQDNRQEDRQKADFLHQTGSLSISFDPSARVGLGVDAGVDRSENQAVNQVTHTHRVGFRSTVRPVSPLAISAFVAPTFTRNDDMRSRNMDVSFESAYSFQLGTRLPARGQVFLRYSRRAAQYRDFLFEIDTENRIWSLNTGVTLTLF